MIAELKPCPFCGSKAIVETAQFGFEKHPRFRVRCSGCTCELGWDFYSEETIEFAWNRRSTDESN